MVAIWTFGLPHNSFEDNAHRGLKSSLDVQRQLNAQSLKTRIGVSSGTAFCGLVRAMQTPPCFNNPQHFVSSSNHLPCDAHSTKLRIAQYLSRTCMIWRTGRRQVPMRIWRDGPISQLSGAAHVRM
eukprot:4040322-Prymnesium_polylepis.2